MNPNIIFAYIDPGTGAIIMQVVIAGILGVGFMFRRVVNTPFAFVARFFNKNSGEKQDSEKQDSENLDH